MANTIKIQPVGGKYLSASVNGKSYDIYLVDPKTGEQGTEVDKEVAIRLLGSRTQLVSLVPVIKDGKFVAQLSPEELKMIRDLKANPELAKTMFAEKKSSENATLEALVRSQASQIQMMMEQMSELKEQIKGSKKSKKEE